MQENVNRFQKLSVILDFVKENDETIESISLFFLEVYAFEEFMKFTIQEYGEDFFRKMIFENLPIALFRHADRAQLERFGPKITLLAQYDLIMHVANKQWVITERGKAIYFLITGNPQKIPESRWGKYAYVKKGLYWIVPSDSLFSYKNFELIGNDYHPLSKKPIRGNTACGNCSTFRECCRRYGYRDDTRNDYLKYSNIPGCSAHNIAGSK